MMTPMSVGWGQHDSQEDRILPKGLPLELTCLVRSMANWHLEPRHSHPASRLQPPNGCRVGRD